MTRTNHIPVLLLGAIPLLVVLTVIAINALPVNRPYVNEPLHSTMEALGAVCAVVMAIFLLQGRFEQDIEKYSPLALGFLGMGVLDGFHAVSRPGDAFIFFHGIANLAGGTSAALIWSPGFAHRVKKINRWSAWAVAGGLIALGAVIILYHGSLPAMSRNGVFTPAAIGINSAAGMLFIIANTYFLVDFIRSRKIESFLFFSLYLLFGFAGLGFPFSAAWNANWWFWHLQRLGAYLVVLYFLVRAFHRIALERERLIVRLHDTIAEVNQLSGLLPICASCKKIRDEKDQWKHIEVFISEHSEAEFSHGLCPDCSRKAFSDLDKFKKERLREGQ